MSTPASPDHSAANAMLAARKQQLAHLQTLQRQQQQVLQQMGTRATPASPGAIVTSYDGRDDRFSSSGLRSLPGSPGGSVGGGSVYRSTSPRGARFECDYDTNPTELYLAVQRKDWDAAIERATSCPHEASTWVSRKEGDGIKLRWRLLPLHAAIIFRAPERTISSLLFAFSQGAACKDDQGMLPLHLAFRNGCDEEVVHSLLMAYPQSVDVQDRKGRTPMVLAQQSTHANRDAYIAARERGPAYYAVANAAKVGMPTSPGVPSMPMMTTAYGSASHLPILGVGADGARIHELEAELAKTQETSQVLVDHVNSLEAQLASRTDTERFLATKIANLDTQLKETTTKLEESSTEVETKNQELEAKDEEKDELAKKYDEEIAQLNVALADKKEAELKSYKLTNRERFDLEERVEIAERDCASAQANAAVLEAQLKKKIETEESLASQVSMLASQLASSASSSSEATGAYQRKCETLETENKKLQSHIEELEGKLGTVATALDAMAAEQERIVEAATKHEQTMAAATAAHQAIIENTTAQETLLEDAAKEREQIVSILMRQAEDAEKTMVEREKVLEAVKAQEGDVAKAAEERDAVIESVSKQREYMDFMLNGELNFLKKTASEDGQTLVTQAKKDEMEEKKTEFLNKDTEEDSEESADQEVEEEANKDTEPVEETAALVEDCHIGDVKDEDKEGYETLDEEEATDEASIDAAIEAADSDDSEDSQEE